MEVTLEEAKKLVKQNESIGYYINYEKNTVNQIMDIWSQEWRVVARIIPQLPDLIKEDK